MRVSISSVVFDIDGHVTIDALPDNTDGGTVRRVNRTATLDGGVSVLDGGYAEGDRTLTYNWLPISKSTEDSIARMVKLYSRVNVVTESGAYTAAPESYTPGGEESSISLLVIEEHN